MTVWSIGHSNHPLSKLVDLLRAYDIEVVADVRSQPYSRRNPQFGREALRSGLAEAGIGYVFLGAELGGRPPEPELLDGDGRERCEELATRPRFRDGLARLEDSAREHRVAMLCSEEDPARCHRRLLVTPALAADGVAVVHLRGDGAAVSEVELTARSQRATDATLFDDPT